MKKGRTNNPNGRPVGSRNRRTEQWQLFVDYCLNGGLEKFQDELNKLEGKDYVAAFISIIEFHKPKLARSEMKLEAEVRHTITDKTVFSIKKKG